MLNPVKEYINDFFNLVYPETCAACNQLLVKNENMVCTRCLYEIPKTNFHKEADNPVEQIFWGRVKIEKATALFYFKQKSKYRRLIHQLKYKGNIEIGVEMGRWLGASLSETGWINEIDVLIPVPLHPKRFKKRGYNQSEVICRGISEVCNKPIDIFSLVRTKASETQTKKSKFDRWLNVETLFAVSDPARIENCHVLLVDDVITTGATLEACIHCLLEVKGVKVSVASLGFTSD